MFERFNIYVSWQGSKMRKFEDRAHIELLLTMQLVGALSRYSSKSGLRCGRLWKS